MLTAGSTLAIFIMLGISSLAVFLARRIRLPHTVILVIIGILLGLLAQFPLFAFFKEFQLTPELLFFLFLPTLIFESAYNINIRRMVEETGIVMVLAVISLLVSTVIIGLALHFVLGLFGIVVPFIFTLLFGALISSTDPVAVLSLFKEFGAPRRLSLIFEGESLFNDATAVALFLILLEIAQFGYHGFASISIGIVSFFSMMLGGILVGIIIGGFFAKLVGIARESEIASITLTIVLAHTTFILTSILSDHLVIGSYHLYLSPIISTTMASLVMGNYGRSKIHPRAEEFVDKLWSQLAFMANSLIFILIGIMVVSVPIKNPTMIAIILTTIIIVATARAISIYPIVKTYNLMADIKKQVPQSWQHLLSWGSLRGALAVTMILIIPENLLFSGWNFSTSPKEFLLALTSGCIIATLFIKATTIQKVMKKLKLNDLTEIEKVESEEARALIHHEVTEKIKLYQSRGYIKNEVAEKLNQQHQEAYDNACAKLATPETKQLSERVLRLYAIGIERRHLKELYHHNEVNETVFKRLTGKLQLQFEAIERGDLTPDISIHSDGKDVFEIMASFIRRLYHTETEFEKIDNLYLYYRAQTIIARKVLKHLGAIDEHSAEHIFSKIALKNVLELYFMFKGQSEKKMNELSNQYATHYQKLSQDLADHGVTKIEETVLNELYQRELITPKLYVTLKEELI
ncbi:sodium:proton exchanger [Candidatus Uhrbacteria bacterium CG_4_10_14_0_2_um_filter_41_21]|nr:MAG: sodium:proton exchanger [Candidatus Uhrbacteria bacterium CG_4_10_14_0_2_um_filter_41_21]